MSERNKIIAVMARLGTFTAKELADASGAKEATVRTVLGRFDRAQLNAGTEEGPKFPGGRRKQFHLRPEGRAGIVSTLRSFVASLSTSQGMKTVAGRGDDDRPIPLLAAIEIIDAIKQGKIGTQSVQFKLNQASRDLDRARRQLELRIGDYAPVLKDVQLLREEVERLKCPFLTSDASARPPVHGVVGIANDVQERLPNVDQRPDPDIARDAVAALKRQMPYSHQYFNVIVRDGRVTLEGQADWGYQREKVERVVRGLQGVKGVVNTIQLKPHMTPEEVKRKIEEALKRTSELDAARIEVEASEGEVVLRGTVNSWSEREEAERAALKAQGVEKVENRIVIQP